MIDGEVGFGQGDSVDELELADGRGDGDAGGERRHEAQQQRVQKHGDWAHGSQHPEIIHHQEPVHCQAALSAVKKMFISLTFTTNRLHINVYNTK